MILILVTSGCGSSRVIAPVEDISVDSSSSGSQTNTTSDDIERNSPAVAPGPIVNEDALPQQQTLAQQQENQGGSEVAPEPVVLALLTEAETLMAQQQHQQALNALERGVRIKPKDPWLWHSMAVVHRQQQNWSEGIGTGRKISGTCRASARFIVRQLADYP